MRLRTVGAFASGPIATAILGLVAVPWLAYTVPIADIGRFYLLQTIVSLATLALSFGLDQAFVREFHVTRDLRSLLRACAVPGVIAGSVICVAALCLGPFPSELIYGVSSASLTILTGAIVLLSVVVRLLSVVVRMAERGWAYSVGQLFPKCTMLMALAYLSVNAHRPLLVLFSSYLAALVLITTWYLIILRREMVRTLRAGPYANYWSLWRYGLPLAFSAFLYWGMLSTAPWILRASSSAEELGLYSLTANVAAAGLLVQGIFATVWAPIAYKWTTQAGAVQRMSLASQWVGCCILLMIALVGASSWILLLILPDHLRDVSWLVPAAVLPPLLYTWGEVTGIGITVARRPIFALIANALALGLNAALLVILVPYLGAAGAVVANALSFFVFIVVRTVFAGMAWAHIAGFGKLALGGAVTLICCLQALGSLGGPAFAWPLAWLIVGFILILLLRRDLASMIAIGRTRVCARSRGPEGIRA